MSAPTRLVGNGVPVMGEDLKRHDEIAIKQNAVSVC